MEDDPVFCELLGMELAIEPVSVSARRLREAMGRVEPAEHPYPEQLDAVFEALCSGDVPEDILVRGGFAWSSPLWHRRKARRRKQGEQLRQWINEGSGALAEALGERSDATLRLARLTLHELETNRPDAEAIEELRADADPAAKRKVEAMLSKLDAWLAGGEDADLGALDAYPGQAWLARCLATYLRYHLRSCGNWMDGQDAEDAGEERGGCYGEGPGRDGRRTGENSRDA